MLRLSQIASNEGITLHGPDQDITGITADSRQVKPGFLFVAIPGARHDGASFISEAVAKGATAVLVPAECSPSSTGVAPPPLAGGVRGGLGNNSPISISPPSAPPASGEEALTAYPALPILTAANILKSVSDIASAFYPHQPETIAAVTGTSGKTSTAQFIREIWQAMGFASASIGTLGFVTAKETRYGSLTTPDAIALHRLLEECVKEGIDYLAIEASSHGLAMHRLDHARLKAAGFTNLSRDHLDYHATMEDYLAAKLRLFQEIMPKGGAAVLNADIPEYDVLADTAASNGLKILSYGKKAKAIKLLDIIPDAAGQILNVEILGKFHAIHLPVIGEFQVWNGLCALGLVIGSGGNVEKAIEGLSKVSSVPGRLQMVGTSPAGGAVFVDYAHKPDALENVLKSLKPHAEAREGSKLGVVFGCGGNRDAGKRPLMGEIATRLADWVIVTDDNPRHEEPSSIRKEILAGCASGGSVQEIADRAKAIQHGIAKLGKGDVLIIAGKGHEQGQTIGDEVHPFDDAEIARKVLGK